MYTTTYVPNPGYGVLILLPHTYPDHKGDCCRELFASLPQVNLVPILWLLCDPKIDFRVHSF